MAASKVYTQPSTEYCIYFVILVNIESWRVEINNIMHNVKYEYDEYFKL